MKADYTRFTFRPRKRFTSVRLQQGRVQLDSDWNELEEITEHLERIESRDVIGIRGAPESGGGFAVEPLGTSETDFRLTNGHIYVGGLLCELQPEQLPIAGFPAATRIELPSAELDGRALVKGDWLELSGSAKAPQLFKVTDADGAKLTLTPSPKAEGFDSGTKDPVARRALTYMTQPELPGPPAPVKGRTDLVYLDVWQRHVTAVEDPEIREEGLMGPDTATRIQTICQVRIAENKKSCKDVDALAPAGSGGRLSTRATPGSGTENLCLVPPGGGYTALENRLYRVEVHDSGNIGGNATFKWSRYNGAVAFPVARFEQTSPRRIWLSGLGDDDVLRVAKGNWVEVLDDQTELEGGTGTLAFVSDIDEGERSIEVDRDIAPGTFQVERHARVRRWDEEKDTTDNGVVKMVSTWTGLENGVEIQFSGGDFKAGDYWAFAARANTGKVDALTEAPARNVQHQLCPLAIVAWPASGQLKPTDVQDCRPPFVSLVDLLSQRVLRYVAGDGQEGRPGAVLPGELVVGVEDGLGRPVANYDVLFTATGGGSLDPGATPSLTRPTGPDGLARCNWRLGLDPDVLGEVTAALKTTPSPQNKSGPVIFRATSYYLSLRYLSGDGQNGRAGQVLPAPLVVGVEDAGGRPVADAKVTFAAAGGGFVGKPGADPTTGSFTDKTGASGEISAVWKLGPDPDDKQEVVATLDGVPPAAGAAGQDGALRLVFRARPHYLSLRYVTGDGREGKPGDTLTDPPLTVGVEDGDGRPVAGVNVVFTPSGNAQVREPGGAFSGAAISVASDAHGIARCEMQLGAQEGVYTTTATLDPALGQDESLAVIFRGLVEPPGEHGEFPIVEKINWDNDGPLSLTLLNRGLEVTFSDKMDPLSLKKRELFVVTVELAEVDPAGKHVGFRSHILNGKLSSLGSNTRWRFTPQPHVTDQAARNWKAEYVKKLHSDEDVRLRVVLKAEGIYSGRGQQLDGEAYWSEGPGGVLGKLERAGDGHQGGDFESWAFLTPPPEPTPEPTPTPEPVVILEPTPLPGPSIFPTIHPSGVPTGFPPFGGGVVFPLTSVEIARTGGQPITVVDSGEERPNIAVADAPAVIEMEVAEPVVGDDAVAFADSLRLVDKDSGQVLSGAPEWLSATRLRITLDGPLSGGQYVVVHEGDPAGKPTFAFDVT